MAKWIFNPSVSEWDKKTGQHLCSFPGYECSECKLYKFQVYLSDGDFLKECPRCKAKIESVE